MIMKKKIDIETWKRKEEYLFFKTFQSPLVGVTVEADCSEAYRKAKASGIPPSLYCMHAALVAGNKVEEFRFREEQGEVFLYDRIHLFAPILTAEHSYKSVLLEYREDFDEFRREAIPVIDRAKSGAGEAHGEGEERRDKLLISVNPWYRFTAVHLSDPAQPHEAFPILTFGKFTPVGEKLMMPVALRVNHGFIDGYHIGRFLDEFQKMLDR